MKTPNIYNPPVKPGTNGVLVRHKSPLEYGDRVYIKPYLMNHGIPGHIVGIASIQCFDRPGIRYEVHLCSGENITANEYDIGILPDDWPDFIDDGQSDPEPDDQYDPE